MKTMFKDFKRLTGLTQTALAKATGLHRQTINMVINESDKVSQHMKRSVLYHMNIELKKAKKEMLRQFEDVELKIEYEGVKENEKSEN